MKIKITKKEWKELIEEKHLRRVFKKEDEVGYSYSYLDETGREVLSAEKYFDSPRIIYSLYV